MSTSLKESHVLEASAQSRKAAENITQSPQRAPGCGPACSLCLPQMRLRKAQKVTSSAKIGVGSSSPSYHLHYTRTVVPTTSHLRHGTCLLTSCFNSAKAFTGKSVCRDGVSLQHVGHFVLSPHVDPFRCILKHFVGSSFKAEYDVLHVSEHPRVWCRHTSLHPRKVINYLFAQKISSQ